MPVTIKNRWSGEVIATVEDTDGLREAVIRLIRQGVSLRDANLTDANLTDADLTRANLTDANLTDADLTRADLTGADFTGADFTGANLTDADFTDADFTDADFTRANFTDADFTRADFTGADFTGANLTGADFSTIRNDLFAVLSFAPAEVPALIAALEQGRVNGSAYTDGECGCLIGTLSIAAGSSPKAACRAVHGLKGDCDRPIERFFYAINRGDTPETSQFAKLAHQWASEWLARMHAAFGTAKETAEVVS